MRLTEPDSSSRNVFVYLFLMIFLSCFNEQQKDYALNFLLIFSITAYEAFFFFQVQAKVLLYILCRCINIYIFKNKVLFLSPIKRIFFPKKMYLFNEKKNLWDFNLYKRSVNMFIMLGLFVLDEKKNECRMERILYSYRKIFQ